MPEDEPEGPNSYSYPYPYYGNFSRPLKTILNVSTIPSPFVCLSY